MIYKNYEIKVQTKKHSYKNIYVVYTTKGGCLFVGETLEESKIYIDKIKSKYEN